MTGHTPGPWSVVNGHLIRVQPTNSSSTICGVHRRGLHGPMYNPAEVLANAYLIAAAPDLLDALKAILPVYKMWTEDAGHDPSVGIDATGDWVRIENAEAAIAKANPE